jgi:hypothetical protein
MTFKKFLQSPGFVIYAFLVGQLRSFGFWLLEGAGVTFGQGMPLNRAMRRQMGVVVNVKSNIIANAVATPAVLNSANLKRGNLREDNCLIAIANGDSVGSIYRLTRVKSNDRISSIKLWAPDIGTTTAASLGLYDTAANGGAVVSVALFVTGQALNAGPYTAVDLTFSGLAVTTAEQRIWEALGLSADPQKDYDVAWTLTGAADAAGSVVTRIQYVSGE